MFEMICEVCNEKPAKIHVTQIQNGEPVSAHLCHDCARKKGMGTIGVPLEQVLGGMVSGEEASGISEVPLDLICCRGCGQTFSIFTETGRLGCSQCYFTFDEELTTLILKLQKKESHVGKVPQKGSLRFDPTPDRELRDLRKRLSLAVKSEKFDLAAQIRDEIKDLED